MNTLPLLQQTLGDDWSSLPAVIQRHYQLDPQGNTNSVIHGIMHIHYPGYIKPVIKIARLMGALIDLKGDAMQVTVSKWITDNSGVLQWRRDIQAPNGKTTVFSSRMEYQRDNELIEFVGLGFGIRLRLGVENHQLIYRSNGHLWQFWKIRIPIPDVLFLGHATIIEKQVDDESFELDFKIIHPMFGKTYEYGGTFHYQ
ncbi:MAG TPA: DUF4166 domain-containing protein [Crenotrichaceae bacterium]|nr:DUF4166 domain-containing protein [Crenotrichaceae bacterium]